MFASAPILAVLGLLVLVSPGSAAPERPLDSPPSWSAPLIAMLVQVEPVSPDGRFVLEASFEARVPLRQALIELSPVAGVELEGPPVLHSGPLEKNETRMQRVAGRVVGERPRFGPAVVLEASYRLPLLALMKEIHTDASLDEVERERLLTRARARGEETRHLLRRLAITGETGPRREPR